MKNRTKTPRMNSLDLSDIKVIDQHCHMYLNQSSIDVRALVTSASMKAFNPNFLYPERTVEQYFKSSGLDETTRSEIQELFAAGKSSMQYKEFVREIAKYLNCSEDADSIVKARNDQASDFRSYTSRLFKDARIETLIFADEIYQDPSHCPVKAKTKLAVHPLFYSVLDSSKDLNEAIRQFESELENLVKKEGRIGMKSYIAYGGPRKGTGLDIGNPDSQTVSREFQMYKEKQGKVEVMSIKNLQDYFTRIAVERSIHLRVPFEFHTGIGGVDILTQKCNPLLLGPLLQDENLRHARIILLHGGYPFVAEAGWMAHFFQNVYLDGSIILSTNAIAAVRRVEEALEWVPYSKFLYSSDGGGLPEKYWVTAKVAKRTMSTVLVKMIEAGIVGEKEAREIAEGFFHKNSERLYGSLLSN